MTAKISRNIVSLATKYVGNPIIEAMRHRPIVFPAAILRKTMIQVAKDGDIGEGIRGTDTWEYKKYMTVTDSDGKTVYYSLK